MNMQCGERGVGRPRLNKSTSTPHTTVAGVLQVTLTLTPTLTLSLTLTLTLTLSLSPSLKVAGVQAIDLIRRDLTRHDLVT